MKVQSQPFGKVELAPAAPGIYAWYYQLFVPKFDIDKASKNIDGAEDQEAAQSLVQSFLKKFIFDPHKESDYRIRVFGGLKPQYAGKIPHRQAPPRSLVERLARDTDRISSLCSFLAVSQPYFASPIYIGVATSLRSRLSTHKRLMLKAREQLSTGHGFPTLSEQATEEEQKDHQFAYEAVIERRISPYDLQVYYLPTAVEGREDALNLENVLNRVNYPLCGRN